jgi:hypothetical protein
VSAFECKVTKAVVWATSDKPDTNKPNCSLDLESIEYQMKELQKGVLTGMREFGATICFDTIITIDKNTQRVWMSFTRTKYADNYDKIKPGTCGSLPRTQVLMNCTGWPKIRKQGPTPARYCDFSNYKSKGG